MPPPRKKEKKEEAATFSPVDPNSGVIRFEVDNASSLNEIGRDSPEVEVGGVYWKLNVCQDDEDFNIFLDCLQDQEGPWSIAVKSQFTLLNENSSKDVTVMRSMTYWARAFGQHFGGYQAKWLDVIDEEKGFIKDDKITVEVCFSILKMKGVKIAESFDFTNSTESSHDVALIIEGEKVYANKRILAAHSFVFNAIFYGDFEEKDEIELKDLNRDEFLEMLRVIYPSRKKITKNSVDYLLKLADRFQIKSLINDAEAFLIASSPYFKLEYLRIADQYRLHGLLGHCLSLIKYERQLDEIKASPFYKDLSKEATRALFEKALQVLHTFVNRSLDIL